MLDGVGGPVLLHTADKQSFPNAVIRNLPGNVIDLLLLPLKAMQQTKFTVLERVLFIIVMLVRLVSCDLYILHHIGI